MRIVIIAVGSRGDVQRNGPYTRIARERLPFVYGYSPLVVPKPPDWASGFIGLNHGNLPDHVFQIDAAPHDWLFPRTAAVVHHGGAGTTAAGLRAGVPSIVVPFFADQDFWGERVHALGAGPKPIPQKQLTAEWLAEAIRVAVTDQAMRARAADLGRRIRAEDGVGRAVEVIQDYLTAVIRDIREIRGSKSSTI